MGKLMRHEGVVASVDDEKVRVRIVQTSACASCKVAHHCNASEKTEKIIEVPLSHDMKVEEGQTVVVTADMKVVRWSLAWAFGLPVVLMIVALILTSLLGGDALMAAMMAVGALAVYYIFLWCMRPLLNRQLVFAIEKRKIN